jgi:N-methylhydantoinase B
MDRNYDPVLIEVVRNELASITEEMAIAVHKTGRSAMVKIGDFATAICDGKGRVIGLGSAMPFQLAVFAHFMPYVIKKHSGNFKPGDVILHNDPYLGASHMPDLMVIRPVFWREQLVAFTLVYSHQTDIGGRFAGGFSSQCTESYEEGMRLPIVKYFEGGIRNEALFDTIMANVRANEEFLGDLEAKIAGCWRGEQELCSALDKYGLKNFQDCCEYLLDAGERAGRAAVREIPPGEYCEQMYLGDDGFGTEGTALPVKVTLKANGDTLTLDFTGTNVQALGAINNPLSNTVGIILQTIHCILCPDSIFNEGFARPINILAPLGTLLNPQFPAAVGGRAPLFFILFEAIYRVLAKAIPGKVPVPVEGGDVLHFTGRREDGSEYAVMDLFWGGWGGRPTKDGVDGVGGLYATVPAEMLEHEYPVVVEGFGFLPDSGGPGKYRGSLSVYKEFRFLQPARIMVRTNRSHGVSMGLAGGRPGNPALNLFNGAKLPQKSHLHMDVNAGDRIYHVIAASGGHGEPDHRDPEKVLADVVDEKITTTAAREQYGVVINPENLTVDFKATARLREARQQLSTASD